MTERRDPYDILEHALREAHRRAEPAPLSEGWEARTLSRLQGEAIAPPGPEANGEASFLWRFVTTSAAAAAVLALYVAWQGLLPETALARLIADPMARLLVETWLN